MARFNRRSHTSVEDSHPYELALLLQIASQMNRIGENGRTGRPYNGMLVALGAGIGWETP